MHEDSPLRVLLSIVVAYLAISYYVMGNFLWGHETHWTNPRFLKFKFLEGPRNFTESDLSRYTGTDPALPIYLAVDGKVFDVSARPQTYGPLGAYRFFSGKDAARAFGTGCFETDLTADLRGLDQPTLASIQGWQRFFENHPNYWLVGYVEHPPFTGPEPAPCKRAQRPS